MTVVGIVAALVAGGLFAVAAVLQQQMAAARPSDEQLSWRLIVHLARQRAWLLGIAVAATSYVVQAVALSFAPLSVVQPLLTAEVIFAVPMSVRRHHLTLHRREWACITAVTAALAVGLAAAHPRPGNPLVPIASWAPILAAATGLVLVTVAVGRAGHGKSRAAGYAIAAAVLMGVESSLMAATAARFEHGATAGFSAWETYAMAVSSISVLLLIQSAFQAGPLAVSMPITDALSPATAIVIGVMLFGERLDSSPAHVTIALGAAVVLILAIAVLDTSPIIQAVHRAESKPTNPSPPAYSVSQDGTSSYELLKGARRR